jgi:hypothetical protein
MLRSATANAVAPQSSTPYATIFNCTVLEARLLCTAEFIFLQRLHIVHSDRFKKEGSSRL